MSSSGNPVGTPAHPWFTPGDETVPRSAHRRSTSATSSSKPSIKLKSEPIRFFNRARQKLETEAVYGERYLRWIYGTAPGRLALRALVKRAAFSRYYGWRMNRPGSRKKILPFIDQYRIDTSEFAKAPDQFRTFNEFFTRKLTPEARPIPKNPTNAVFPADGRHSGFPDVSAMDGFCAKGTRFQLPSFLQDYALAERYARGAMVFSRLCPVDCHRFHTPAAGVPGPMRSINGCLYSVNPIALRRGLTRLWENKRTIIALRTEHFGEVLICLIGATCVGGMIETYRPCQAIEAGAEMGYFAFGGSAVISLFEPGKIALSDDLEEWTRRGIELYARMGEELGRATG